MPTSDEIKKELGAALQKIAQHTIKDCYFCGEKINTGRAIFNFIPEKGALFIRYLIICPRCNENKVVEIEQLKKGERLNLGIFDV